jgi:hypothetical protein
MSGSIRTEDGTLRLPLRLLWNDDERRPRAPVRLVVGVVLVLVLANATRTVEPTVLGGDGPVADVLNTLVGGLPQAAGIALGTLLVALVVDRRMLSDLGLGLEPGTARRFAGGVVLGAAVTAVSIAAGLVVGFYEFAGLRVTGGPAVWVVLLAGTAVSQLLIVVPEELLARGYVITNALEGLDGITSVPRPVAAGVSVTVSALFFYLTHSFRGQLFGIMAGGLAVLLGVAYVVSGDLSVPIGIHFGLNVAGMLGGTAPQAATLVRLSSSTTVAESLSLPVEAAVVRLLGAGVATGLVVLWYRSASGHVRVVPSLARPSLRWSRTERTTE